MGFITLILQCCAMTGASLLVGSLPLVFNAHSSARTLSAIQVLGMGLLVGAALTIIIPEGVDTLASAHAGTHTIGISLLSGFAIMLLLSTPHISSLVENLSPHPPHPSYDDEAAEPMLPDADKECETHAAAHGLSATLGLVIHGIADGIALGASSLGSANLGLVVFLAILVHKGPAALGLTTTLLNLHLTPSQVRHRLVVFSLSAPAGAIITYCAVQAFGAGAATKGHHGLDWWTGVVLLFSGGSFLYVATVLQPITQTGPDDHCHDVHHEVHKRDAPEPLRPAARTGLILTGMVLPVLLSLLVGPHDHKH